MDNEAVFLFVLMVGVYNIFTAIWLLACFCNKAISSRFKLDQKLKLDQLKNRNGDHHE